MSDKLRKQKIRPGDYAFIMPNGRKFATVVRTGEYSRDPYPWEWYLEDTQAIYIPGIDRLSGHADNMAECVDKVQNIWSVYLLHKTA